MSPVIKKRVETRRRKGKDEGAAAAAAARAKEPPRPAADIHPSIHSIPLLPPCADAIQTSDAQFKVGTQCGFSRRLGREEKGGR